MDAEYHFSKFDCDMEYRTRPTRRREQNLCLGADCRNTEPTRSVPVYL
jgi:hypothetical protein